MELNKQQEQLIGLFHKHLGSRFPVIEVASDNAPISICAYDTEDKAYWIHLEDKIDESIFGYDKTGIKISNVHFYQLYSMISEGSNLFWMSLFRDGYILFYLNDCCTPEQLKVTDEFTAIGVTSALHIHYDEEAKTIIPPATLTASFSDFSAS
jgi:hypothetical protein